MEPSRIDMLQAELARNIRASRRQESYLPLHILAELIGEALDSGEHHLLAELLIMYAQETTVAAARA
jgi:hypothetical protein